MADGLVHCVEKGGWYPTLIYMYEQDLALNILRGLICHKTQQINQYWFIELVIWKSYGTSRISNSFQWVPKKRSLLGENKQTKKPVPIPLGKSFFFFFIYFYDFLFLFYILCCHRLWFIPRYCLLVLKFFSDETWPKKKKKNGLFLELVIYALRKAILELEILYSSTWKHLTAHKQMSSNRFKINLNTNNSLTHHMYILTRFVIK